MEVGIAETPFLLPLDDFNGIASGDAFSDERARVVS